MIECISDNITSPLGWTTNENFEEVKRGDTRLKRYDSLWGLPESFVGSMFDDGAIEARFAAISPDGDAYTRFEKLAILSIREAIDRLSFSVINAKTVLILSTTKANVELLDPDQQPNIPRERASICAAAQQINNFFGFHAPVVVVSNACISGVSAQVIAKRLLERGYYRRAVVCGCDILSKFIVSGFQSFKALSDAECRPFDSERRGLNLGEAAATIVLQACGTKRTRPQSWVIQSAAVRNDANHISGPSRTGEGSYRALKYVLPRNKAQLAFVNVHGTATPYNDEMEAIALSRARLTSVPVNAMKGYYGHTLGAAGVLETILSMKAVEEGVILPTRGFQQLGVTHPVNIVHNLEATDQHQFIKLLSGFGGCNAAVRWTNGPAKRIQEPVKSMRGHISHTVYLSATHIVRDHKPIPNVPEGATRLTYLYKTYIGDYPKFHKMDGLSKLGFIATELLLTTIDPAIDISNSAIVLVGNTGCLATDKRYQRTIQDQQQFFPSPAVFVYTLPNIVTGEIAIRHKIHGETAYYALSAFNKTLFHRIITSTFDDAETDKIIGGWIQYDNDDNFEASLGLYTVNKEIS